MKLPHFEKSDGLLVLFGLTFVVYGWFALTLTLGSLFLFPLIAVGFVLSLGLALLILYRLAKRSHWSLLILLGVILFATLTVTLSSEPTLFSGRDQGSIAEAAYRLAAETRLPFSSPASEAFFAIYGEGTALNFPGFAYTKEGTLITQFPLAYTAWLGSFISLFGVTGYAIGNAVLLFLSFFFLYQLIRLFADQFYAWAGLLLALFSFLPNWFAKSTLSENLALFLFVFLAYSLTLFLRQGTRLAYVSILLSSSLFAFTRIEGFAFLGLTLILLLCHPRGRALWRSAPWQTLILPGLLFLFVFLRDFFLNVPYYKMIGKALLKFLGRFDENARVLGDMSSVHIGSVFFLYGFLALALFGLFGLLLFVRYKHYELLLPAYLALPTFLYLFLPNITLDHPWMLRRYLFTLFPTLLVATTLTIGLLFARKRSLPIEQPGGKRLIFVSLIIAGLLILEFPAWRSQLFYAEARGLREQVATVTEGFTDTDLILVDRHATGDGFTMLSGPGQFLSGKNTVYFFNPYDLAALDTSRFTRVYLLVPEESQSRYAAVFGERLVYVKSINFVLNQFENLTLSDALRLPTATTIETKNTLFQLY